MEYETSYDTGLKPFNHDKNRGKWASSKDFFFACAGHAFKADAMIIMPFYIFDEIGVFAVVPYMLVLAVCVVPIVFIQSFLGQFSSTGFISVFRISPLFKGMGYVSLVVNFMTLTYYSVFSAIPLFHFLHSLRPTIPWSCEGAKSWMKEKENTKSFCPYHENTSTPIFHIKIPSVEFFNNHLNITTYDTTDGENSFSGQLMVCTIIIWGIVAFILLKPTEFIGRYVRYSFLAVITIMSICLLRFAFLPGATKGLKEFFFPAIQKLYWDTWVFLPALALSSSLGPGWGSILTMASFNKFKTDIFTYSWVMCKAQFGIMIGISLMSICIKHFMEATYPESTFNREYHQTQWLEFLRLPTGITFLEWPHFWTLLFFGMWILGSLNVLVIQFLSLMTSIFDEFEELRETKRTFILGAVGIFIITSILFCSNHGFYFFGLLAKYTIIIQTFLNLLLLLVVLWVYGRERFQRDINFMTTRIYSTWMVYIVRFITPLLLMFGLLITMVLSMYWDDSPTIYGMVAILFGSLILLLSFCLIPGYCIVKIKQTTGMIGTRLRRCVRPTDWYPADPVYKQRYEETFSSTDLSHPLTEEALG